MRRSHSHYNRETRCIISISSDSQADFKRLVSNSTNSKLGYEFKLKLQTLTYGYVLTMVWESGRIAGYENADALARNGSSVIFIGPEPALGFSLSAMQKKL